MLCKLFNSDNIPTSVNLRDNCPVSRRRIKVHLIHDVASAVGQLHQIDLELDILLFIVAHELQLDFELGRTVGLRGRHYHMVRLLPLVRIRELHLTIDFDLLEEDERQAI